MNTLIRLRVSHCLLWVARSSDPVRTPYRGFASKTSNRQKDNKKASLSQKVCTFYTMLLDVFTYSLLETVAGRTQVHISWAQVVDHQPVLRKTP